MKAEVCKYLKEEIFPQIVPAPYGDIEATRLTYARPVYLFYEKTKHIMVVGKAFECGLTSLEEAWLSVEKEFFNLKLLRERFGMSQGIDRVVAPLGENRELSALLVTERAPGQTLDYYIARAIYENRTEKLFQKLGCLARFFAKLHRTSENGRMVSVESAHWYMAKLIATLRERPPHLLNGITLDKWLSRWWEQSEVITSDREVVVHGDATPTNFLFDRENVTGIDLERLRWDDRCWDLGFIAAELKHHFMWRMGNGWAAEPFIGHFLWQYAAAYGDIRLFHIITRKIPLFMAMGLLRIARNDWLDVAHRKALITEARRCLKYGL